MLSFPHAEKTKQNFLLTPRPLPVSAPILYLPLQQKDCLFMLPPIPFLPFSLKCIPIRLLPPSLLTKLRTLRSPVRPMLPNPMTTSQSTSLIIEQPRTQLIIVSFYMHLLFHIRTPRSSGSLPTSLAAISQSSLLCPPILPKTLTGQGPWTPSWGSSLSPLMISSTNNRLSAEDIQFLLLAYNSHLISKLVFSMAYLIYPLGCRVDILNLTHPKLNSDFLLLNESLPHVH